MDRRSFVMTAVASTAGSSLLHAEPARKSPSWFELRFYHLRNDLERKPLDDFLKNSYLPLCRNSGIAPVGCFNVSAGGKMPMLVTLTTFPSLSVMESFTDSLASDPMWKKAVEEFSHYKPMVYTRFDSSLLRAFVTMPVPENFHRQEGKDPRLFELRSYESRNLQATLTKIKMFEEEEIGIFRVTGLNPVFFGHTVVGHDLPNLTYMLVFPNMEAREEAWRKFLGHPDWIKLRSRMEFADSEIVSNINNCFLRATAYSEID
jgi:hypothetical protein